MSFIFNPTTLVIGLLLLALGGIIIAKKKFRGFQAQADSNLEEITIKFSQIKTTVSKLDNCKK